MKIAFITLGFNPERRSGLDISGERLVKGLLGRGHQVTVIALGRKNTVEEIIHPALKIFRIQPDPSDWIGFSWKSANLLDMIELDQEFDIKHFWDVHFAYAYRDNYVASLQHSFRQRINAVRSSLPRKIYYHLARLFAERPSIKKANGLIAGSYTTQIEFVREYNLTPDQVTLARHGIDIQFFNPVHDASTLRDNLGITKSEPVIMFAGFVTQRKGFNYLANALTHIIPPPRLILLGKINKQYRKYIDRLPHSIRSQIIERGFVPDEEMPRYYSMADLYISTSLLEGFGLPIAEALACGTPVVAFDGGAVAEVVGDGGIIIPARDSVSLANAISDLLQNPDQRRALGRIGREHISTNFSLETMVDSMIKAYERFAEN